MCFTYYFLCFISFVLFCFILFEALWTVGVWMFNIILEAYFLSRVQSAGSAAPAAGSCAQTFPAHPSDAALTLLSPRWLWEIGNKRQAGGTSEIKRVKWRWAISSICRFVSRITLAAAGFRHCYLASSSMRFAIRRLSSGQRSFKETRLLAPLVSKICCANNEQGQHKTNHLKEYILAFRSSKCFPKYVRMLFLIREGRGEKVGHI